MRNQILKKADSVLRALEAGALTRAELEQRLEKLGLEMSKDILQNLLWDLIELGMIERRSEYYRIGIRMAEIWRRTMDAEKAEALAILKRVENLTDENLHRE